ncbi:RsbT co-antagonist protein RsbRA [Enhygromyxa salina]|uniref:RsbT co-antagonist protein RsbRA n=1 Tax=Enhygromyxa salina TaxID=215803 RepID=A0A2S9XE52_9BACT|nr:STAS domain-containing protein [Enhygromyxa salina]PRP91040.1 RsbT co-antagonist protein RsbRA [Enhygromyxa salina]
MPFSGLERVQEGLADAIVEHLTGRVTSAFSRIGEERCRGHVEATLGALAADIQASQRKAIRKVVQGLIETLSEVGLTFSDLRFFAQTLRKEVRSALGSEDGGEALREAVEEWFFEFVLVCTMRFTVKRETELQERAVKHELERLESQLVELESALEEKTDLLEMIRQASTPIAPVVRGILVVPLVGTFDTFRAELLTEKLLHEIARLQTRATIIDISGVPVFDTAAAQLIIRLARAVRLLGTEVFLVGMSPKTARTIVALGVDLSNLHTLSTLQDGLAKALVLQRMKIVRT